MDCYCDTPCDHAKNKAAHLARLATIAKAYRLDDDRVLRGLSPAEVKAAYAHVMKAFEVKP